jgi:hypothetical protein
MRAVPEDEVDSARGNKAEQEKALRVGEAAKHLRSSFCGNARFGAGALDGRQSGAEHEFPWKTS